MIVGTGIDIVPIHRMERALQRWGRRFQMKIFTLDEQRYAEGKLRRAHHLAARFAVKEAVLKALGSGLSAQMKWSDIEVVNRSSGQPEVKLFGAVRHVAHEKRIKTVHISIAHAEGYAVAQAIAES